MKIQTCRRTISRFVLGLTLVAAAQTVTAQENFVVDTFDSEDSATQWTRWWGSAPQAYEFDGTVDAANNASSGSLKATIDFDLATYGGDNQFAVVRGFPDGAVVDGTKYTNLVFSLRWASSSPQRTDGDFGYLEYGFRNQDFSQTWLGGQAVAIASGDQWVQVKVPIDRTTAKLDTITGVVLKLWSGTTGGLTGSSVFWLDDVMLLANTNQVAPPPSMKLASATAGLRLAASAPGQQYQRQSVRTQATDAEGNGNGYSWVSASGPVTYAITIKEYAPAAYSGFQTHLFLAPEAGMPYGPGDTSIDWNTPNLVFVQIANNEDGTASARFMYKTNLPSGNAMFWNTDPANGPVGTLASINDPSPTGTWTVKFENNTSVTLTTPSGTSTNFAMPAAAAELFADPLYVYLGSQPNQVANIGQAVTVSRFQITGVSTPLDDSFAGETLDAAKWQVVAADASGIIQVPSTTKYWLTWDAPATGFAVQSATALGAGSWADAGLTNIVQIGSQKAVLVPAANLPSPTTGFFRLMKP
ncbi:MAG: hypothetical protein JNK85_22030 [Verrucomicrobiales bacterium]|nr:hypothetical protein [Verrucomicrobiales bacterium]